MLTQSNGGGYHLFLVISSTVVYDTLAYCNSFQSAVFFPYTITNCITTECPIICQFDANLLGLEIIHLFIFILVLFVLLVQLRRSYLVLSYQVPTLAVSMCEMLQLGKINEKTNKILGIYDSSMGPEPRLVTGIIMRCRALQKRTARINQVVLSTHHRPRLCQSTYVPLDLIIGW